MKYFLLGLSLLCSATSLGITLAIMIKNRWSYTRKIWFATLCTLISGFCCYWYLGLANDGTFHVLTMAESVKNAIVSLTLTPDYGPVRAQGSDVLVLIAFLALMLAVLVSDSALLLGLGGNTLKRAIRFFKLRGKTIYVIWGKSDNGYAFAKAKENRDCTVYYIEEVPTKEEMAKYNADGVLFYYKSLAELCRKSKEVRFLCLKRKSGDERALFEEQVQKLKAYVNLMAGFPEEKEKLKIYLEIEEEDQNVIIDLAEKAGLSNNVNCFHSKTTAVHQLLNDHPITSYLNSHFLDTQNATIKPNTEINVFFIGFGRTNKAIFERSVCENSFGQLIDGRVTDYPIHYYIFDREDMEGYGLGRGHDHHRYGNFLAAVKDRENYFPFPRDPMAKEFVTYKPGDLRLEPMFNEITRTMYSHHDKPVANFLYVSFGDDVTNLDFSTRILKWCEQEKLLEKSEFVIHLFAKESSDSLTNMLSGVKDVRMDLLTTFGNKEKLYSREIIINESLLEMAQLISQNYCEKHPNNPSWEKLAVLYRESNLSAARSVRTKLNLMGLDYKRVGKNRSEEIENGKNLFFGKIGKTKEQYEKACQGWTEELYNQFWLSPNVIKNLCFVEHARWNAFQIFNGFVPMPKKKKTMKCGIETEEEAIAYIGKEEDETPVFKTKNAETKEHACLTTYDGIDELANYCSNRLDGSDSDKKKAKFAISQYGKDMEIFLVIPDILEKANCFIVKWEAGQKHS